MFDTNGKICASIRQFFSAGFSISSIYKILDKFRFRVALRRIHGKILPIILIDQVKVLKQFFQSASWRQLVGNTLLATRLVLTVLNQLHLHISDFLLPQKPSSKQSLCTVKAVTK